MYILSASPVVTNCILWNDTGSGEIYDGSSSASVTYSCVSGGYTGTGNIGSDPLFVDGGAGNVRLQCSGSASPCIGAGSNEALPLDVTDLDGDGRAAEKLPVDLDGNPRVVDGTVDMGAYECQ